VVKTEVEGGPRGFRGGEDQRTKTDFGGECWSCGGCHRSDRCEFRWKRQLANAVRRLLQVGKGDLWIASEVRSMMGQVRRSNRPGPAAVKVVELPRPRPKEGGGGEQASVHAIAEEKRPKAKTGQAKPRGGMAKDEVTGPGDMAALQRQVEELSRTVGDLKVQRVSTNREIKLQRAWMEGEVKERAMAAQVQQAEERMGALEAGLAAQVHRAEESRSQIEFQRVWVEGELKGLVTGEQLQQVEEQMVALVKQVEAQQAELEWQSRWGQKNCVVEERLNRRLRDVWSVGQVEARMSAAVKEQVSRLEQEGCVVVALVKQVEERLREVQGKCEGLETIDCQSLWRVQMEGSIEKLNADADRLYQRGRTAGERLQQVAEQLQQVAAGADESTKTLLEKGEKLQRRLRDVEERPDMTERLESIETSVQVCVNSVRVLHSYVEAKGSSDSDGEGT